MSERWKKWILYVAGGWNILGGMSALLAPYRYFDQLYNGSMILGDPLQAFFFRASWINVIAWGIAYILAAGRAGARVPVLLAGGLGKTVYFVCCVSLFRSGVGTTTSLAFGVLDVLFALFFFYVLWSQRKADCGGPP